MASGLPQVVSDWDGYRDTVAHGETGFRVPTYCAAPADDADALYALADSSMTDHLAVSQAVAVDPGELRRCLEQLIERPELRARMGEASRRRAPHFDWRHVIRQYEALWADMAARPGRRPATSALWYLPHSCSALQYATRALDRAATMRLTSAGHGVVRGSKLLPEWPLRRAVIDLAIERCALQCLATHEPLPVQEVVDSLCAEQKVSPHSAMRHVMWLMKYGFVEAGTVGEDVLEGVDDAACSWRWAT
jgi:D-inositol-3-phosphate glycosyltransferase